MRFKFIQEQVTILRQRRLPIYEEELWCNIDKVVYGPVASRRLGESLGINLFPNVKICSFNCCYCDLHFSPPEALNDEFIYRNLLPPEKIIREIEIGIKYCLDRGLPIDYITICGNGEATCHPYFCEIAEFLLRLRDKMCPNIPLAILTNSSTLNNDKILKVINEFDEKFCKLDAGDEETFMTINRPLVGSVRFHEIVQGLKKVERLNIQTAVVDSVRLSNIPSLKGPFLEILNELQPQALYIHNIDYPPFDKTIRRLRLNEMVKLAEFIAKQSGIPVKVLHSLINLRRRPRMRRSSQ